MVAPRVLTRAVKSRRHIPTKRKHPPRSRNIIRLSLLVIEPHSKLQIGLTSAFHFENSFHIAITVEMPRASTAGNGSPTRSPQTDDEGTAMGEPKAVQDEEQAAPSRPSGISANTVTASNHGREPKNADLVSQSGQITFKR